MNTDGPCQTVRIYHTLRITPTAGILCARWTARTPPEAFHLDATQVRKLTPEMRREQTRTYLLDAAAAVFAAHGFHDASLDEIAEAAGFTKGAIYSNFGSKADLFLALADRREHERFSGLLHAAQAQPDRTRLWDAMRDAYRQVLPSADEWALWQEFELSALRKPELRKALADRWHAQFAVVVDVMRRQLATDGREPPVPVEAVAHLFIAVFERVARTRALDPDFEADAMFATLVDFIATIVFGPSTD